MGAEGLGALGRNEKVAKVIGEKAANKLAGFSEEITRPAMEGAELTAADVLGNLGAKGAARLRSGGQANAMESMMAGQAPAATPFREAAAEALPKMGRAAGQVLHGVGQVGQAGERLLGGVSSGVASGIGRGGQAMAAGGRGVQSLARGARPMDPYAAYGTARAGMDEAMQSMPDMRSEEQIMFDRWLKRRQRDNMGLDFVQR